MRTYINYDNLIYYLLKYKEELYRVKEEEYQGVINILSNSNIEYDDEGTMLPIPTRNEIARQMRLKNTDVNKLLKNIYHNIIASFSFEPLVIKDYIHSVFINIPYDEWKEDKLKKDPRFYYDFLTSFEVKLPYTPRIGEQISFPFLMYKDMCVKGYVCGINHSIEGNTCVIKINVHPYDNEYARWQKMKEEYEEYQRWKRYMERQREMKDN